MESKPAVLAFAALAHETRLAAFRALVRAGPAGLAAGVLAERLSVAPSTLSHHLAALEHAGLIAAVRRQRSLIYAVDQPTVRAVIAFLVDDCCGGAPDLCGFPRAPA